MLQCFSSVFLSRSFSVVFFSSVFIFLPLCFGSTFLPDTPVILCFTSTSSHADFHCFLFGHKLRTHSKFPASVPIFNFFFYHWSFTATVEVTVGSKLSESHSAVSAVFWSGQNVVYFFCDRRRGSHGGPGGARSAGGAPARSAGPGRGRPGQPDVRTQHVRGEQAAPDDDCRPHHE